MTQLVVTKFETGAMRDKKEVPVRWDLFSAVSLSAIASAAELPPDKPERGWLSYVGDAANQLLVYIGGKRDLPYLERAWWSLSNACDLKELSEIDYRERACMRRDVPVAHGNYSLLSYQALKHTASTLEEGCGKYGEWNWLYGFPLTSTISHALDHIWALTNADRTEDHWGHAFCNLMFAIHVKETRPDLCGGMLGDWFLMTDEIKIALEAQREERARHEQLGRQRIPDGRRSYPKTVGGPLFPDDGILTTEGFVNRDYDHSPRRSGDADRPHSAKEVAAGHRPPGDFGDEWEGVAPNADGSTALGRAVESARGGPTPVPRQGFA